MPIEDTEETKGKTANEGVIFDNFEMETLENATTDVTSPVVVATETPMPDRAEAEHPTTAEANQRTELPKLDLADPPPESAHTPPMSSNPAVHETNPGTDNAELFVPASTSPYPSDLRRSGRKTDKNRTMSASPARQPQHCPGNNEDPNGQLCDINRHELTTEPMPATNDDCF